ncbi:Phosphatidylinositolglycan class N-domain-containing protein [Suillus discolor]|uniref:GPI ethanolamine phosphate transferase 1 n=1 Tax=Suillus discolor TaxID=1912936 RepID=A0A9P7K171_9AGAM|nr:Phosphatidylinositolglycan class N-domain-containing protein [Suillus discolor]KAG2120771.1 Phosphatidylinositolglycan class N-domain-containing protein [Suillus discolor]
MTVSSHRNALNLVVHGILPRRAGSGEAKRVVLIVGDSLRADLLFGVDAFSSLPKIVVPYVRDIIQTRGAFGLSHTRVPTESRPGHVAIIGGMYEDISAVTKGWKTNPVHFDSIFNQSSHTFSFGSPDILPMFAQGATPGKVDTWSYDEEDEDFTKDATALDIWVLDQLWTLFQNASLNDLLDSELRADKVVFFLHLLGLDTTGHSYRPHSKEYMNNIQVVDRIVQQTEELFSNFYHDEETNFVFTADRGMSRIGNHGDVDPDNTRTPLIAWGRGIRGPLPDIIPSLHDEYFHVEQADLAPLMAALLGINYPVNSVGILPDADPTILEHYRVKHGASQMRYLASLIEGHRETTELIKVTLQGLRYLETYNRVLIRIIVIVVYLGWSAYASLSICPLPASSVSDRQPIFWALFAAERAPWTFYVYVTFPCYFWQQFALRGVPIVVQQFKSSDRRGHFIDKVLFHLIIVVVVLQCMVAAYTHRHVRSQHPRLLLSWMSNCPVTGIFPLLSVNKREDLYMIMCGGAMILAVGAGCTRLALDGAPKAAKLSKITQMLFILLAMTVTASSVKSLQAKQGLSIINQTSAWLILAVSSIYPFISKAQHSTPTSRIISLFLSFGICFIILSISVEGLFYVAFTCNLLLWIEVEAIVQSNRAGAASQNQGYEFHTDNIKIALFFLFFVQVAFFGTGKSFYLEPVYSLVPIFNPFLMAALLWWSDYIELTYDTGSWLEIGQSISFFCITSLLLVWSAGICTAGEYLMVDILVFHKSMDSHKLE